MSDIPSRYADAERFSFGDSPAMADELLALVLADMKTASCGALRDLLSWRSGHEAYFRRNGGYAPDMVLLCERFRLVEVLATQTKSEPHS